MCSPHLADVGVESGGDTKKKWNKDPEGGSKGIGRRRGSEKERRQERGEQDDRKKAGEREELHRAGGGVG